jgi:trans-aconitate methyltransferase
MRLYSQFASWWPLVSHPEEYASYASWYAGQLTRYQDARTVLELGSGGGNKAYHMKHRFSMTLVGISGEMLSVSETTNPECEHVRGDMRTVRLAWCASPVDPRVMSYAALARADLP